MEIAIISDTHMPRGGRRLPNACTARLRERGEGGFQIFNPGSPTERRRAPRRTMGMARVRGGRIVFELVELD